MREASLFQQQLGCVTPQAFGLAAGLPHRRIVSLDTDGGMMFNLGILASKGSLYVTRPTLNTHTTKRETMVAMAKNLFDAVLSGKVKIQVNATFPLKDAAEAHRALESRGTTGSTVLVP